jgi:hypothetical protein
MWYNEGMKSRGVTVVELVLGAAVISLFFYSIYSYYISVLRTSNLTTRYIQSAYLLEEGVEAVKSIRNENYTTGIKSLDKTKTYGLLWNGSTWSATTTPERIDDIFTRTINLEKAYRDGSSNLAVTGTEDTDTVKITVNVSWGTNGGGSKTVTASTYVQNIFSN